MDKTNLRFDWIGETTIEKHWDDLTRDELLMYVDWLEKRLVKNCSIPDVVGQSEQLVCDCPPPKERKGRYTQLKNFCAKCDKKIAN